MNTKKVFTTQDLQDQVKGIEALGYPCPPDLLKRARSWQGVEHPIIIDIIGTWNKAAVIELYRRGLRLGTWVQIRPASVAPFYTIMYQEINNYSRAEMVTTETLHILEVTKVNPLFYCINIPE